MLLKANGMTVEFTNSWRGNRSGFVHETRMVIDGVQEFFHKQQYYNRTWERYEYQSVMKSACYDAIEYVTKKLTDKFRAENSIKRLTKARKGDLEVILKNSQKLKNLENIYRQLD